MRRYCEVKRDVDHRFILNLNALFKQDSIKSYNTERNNIRTLSDLLFCVFTDTLNFKS